MAERTDRETRDLVAFNRHALARLRDAANRDPQDAATTYRMPLRLAQRLARMPFAALTALGNVALPLMRADPDGMREACAAAVVAIDQPVGLRAKFEGGNDPKLALHWLTILRADAWRDEVVASVRWGLPRSVVRAVADVPITALEFVADATALSMIQHEPFFALLAMIESNALAEPDRRTKLALLVALAEQPVQAGI